MPRFFLEVSYKGAAYKGFQVQQNARTIQGEIEKALQIIFRQQLQLTGSSRTDAGVHALQNFFHFDSDLIIGNKQLYNLNSVLPGDIALKNIFEVATDAHCRFHAISREYQYHIYHYKNPFLIDRAYYYPFQLNISLLQQAAETIIAYHNFTSFSKRKTQVKNFNCNILSSSWKIQNDCLVYTVLANRFLRGMVKGLVGTMLKVGRGTVSLENFQSIIESADCTNVDFSIPPHGLFLTAVKYPFTLK